VYLFAINAAAAGAPGTWGSPNGRGPCSIHGHQPVEGHDLGGGVRRPCWPAPGPTAPLPAAFMLPGSETTDDAGSLFVANYSYLRRDLR